MAGNSAFTLVNARGWRGGFGNLLRLELSRWFRTRRLWGQALLWTVIINGILAPVLWSAEAANIPEGVTLFSIFCGLFPGIAIVIIMQDVVVGEKESGTAAWVLSKPASRTAFLLSKLLANMLGVLLAMYILPGLVAYVQLSQAGGEWLPPLRFAGGVLVLWIHGIYYLTLTLMLGVFFSHRAPVIGLPLALAFGQQLIFGLLPALANILPWTIAVPLGENPHSIASAVMSGARMPSVTPFYVALGCIVVFVAVGLWRFEREEL